MRRIRRCVVEYERSAKKRRCSFVASAKRTSASQAMISRSIGSGVAGRGSVRRGHATRVASSTTTSSV
jgi:hypothetical protein